MYTYCVCLYIYIYIHNGSLFLLAIQALPVGPLARDLGDEGSQL